MREIKNLIEDSIKQPVAGFEEGATKAEERSNNEQPSETLPAEKNRRSFFDFLDGAIKSHFGKSRERILARKVKCPTAYPEDLGVFCLLRTKAPQFNTVASDKKLPVDLREHASAWCDAKIAFRRGVGLILLGFALYGANFALLKFGPSIGSNTFSTLMRVEWLLTMPFGVGVTYAACSMASRAQNNLKDSPGAYAFMLFGGAILGGFIFLDRIIWSLFLKIMLLEQYGVNLMG